MLITDCACWNLHYLLAIDTGRQAEDPIHEQDVLTNIILLTFYTVHIVYGGNVSKYYTFCHFFCVVFIVPYTW